MAVVLLITTPSFLAPFAYSTSQEGGLPSPDAIRSEALRYAHAISSRRKDFPLLIPALGVKRGAKIGSGALEADMFVLVFPAAPGKVEAATTTVAAIISDMAVEFFKNLGNLENPAYTLAKFYKIVYEKLVEAGAKPAFLPYENVTFVILVVIWIKASSLTEIITGLGLSAVKAAADGIITVIIALSGNALDIVRENIRTYADSLITDLIDKMKNEVRYTFNNLIDEIENIPCTCKEYVEKDDQTVCILYGIELNTGDALTELRQRANTRLSEAAQDISSNSYKNFVEVSSQNVNSVLESTHKDASNLYGIISEDTKKDANQIIDKFGRNIAQNLMKNLPDEFINKISEVFKVNSIVEGQGSSCEEAKQNAKAELLSIADTIIGRLDVIKVNLVDCVDKMVGSEIDEMKAAVSGILSTIRGEIYAAINEAEEQVKEVVESAISNVAAATSAPVFVAYALGQGLFQAMQTWVKDVTVTCPIGVSGRDEERMLVVQKDSPKVTFLSEDDGDKITASGSPPVIDQIASAAKGFVRGFLGTLASVVGTQKAIEKVIDAVPSLVAVNIKMEDSKKYFIAQPKPGIYFMKINLNVKTGADIVGDAVEGFRNALFGGTKVTENTYLNTLKGFLDSKAEQSGVKTNVQVESGANLVIPYLVLPPYFVAEETRVESGVATITLAAVYDFAALLRPQLDKLRNELYKLRYEATNVEQVIEEMAEKISGMLKDSIIDIIFDKFNEMVNNAKYAPELSLGLSEIELLVVVNFIENIKEFIKGKISELIRDAIENYLEKVLDFAKGLIYEATKYVDLGVDALFVADQLIATTLTLLKVNVVNSGKMGVVALIPELGVASQPIDDKGIAKVTVRLESLRGRGPASLGAVPAFQRLDPEGKVSYVRVPGSIASLEPLVVPLVPVAILTGGKLVVRFTTPFNKDPWLSYTGISIETDFFADGKPIAAIWDKNKGYIIDFERYKGAGAITLKIRHAGSGKGCSLGVAVLVPVADEVPVYVNPQALAERA
jgi:division protein CdvB (Snf7/Vps24/ESCRT-III family)